MTKKKVFCYNCAYFKKEVRMGSLGPSPYLLDEDGKCLNPNKDFGSKKVKATAIKPAHTIPITIPPDEINMNNDCTGWMFLAEKPEYSNPSKPWWKFWRRK